MKQHLSQLAVVPNRVIKRIARLSLMAALLLITIFAQATSILGQGLEDRIVTSNRKNTAVIFPNNIVTRPTLLTETMLEATIPGRVVNGDVVVSAPAGISNGAPFQVGSSFMPTEAGEASIWDSTFSGVINSDTVWNTNLLLTGDVTVPAGVTLTIESGVTIFASANNDDQNGGMWTDKTELLVFGTLQVNGSETAPVYFTSDAAEKAPGNWGGIQIREGSTTSQLSNCMVRYANEGIRLASIKVSGAVNIWAKVQNCSIQHNQTGISMRANPDWPNGAHVNLGAEITNNLIANNVNEGIYLRNWCGYQSATTNPVITNNVIKNNGTGIYLLTESWWIGHVDDRTVIRNNTINNNQAYGIFLEMRGSLDSSGSDTDSKTTVENNLLFENQTNINLYLDSRGLDGLQDFQPTIQYNTIRDASYGILVSDTQSYGIFAPIINHNVFEGYDGSSSYAISNETDRTINVESNYWGSTPAEWDAGMPASFVIGPVFSLSHLDSTSAPIITRFAPELGQTGDNVTVYGANFGNRRR